MAGHPAALIVGVEAVDGNVACAVVNAVDARVLARRQVASVLTWDISALSHADTASASILAVVTECLAGVPSAQGGWAGVIAICVATTAVDLGGEEAEAALRAAFRTRLPDAVKVLVYNSGAAALASGTGGPLLGCALVAGIESSRAYGAMSDRRTAAASGWGPVFSDGGCAYDLGMRALSAVSRAQDGRGADTLLVNAVCRHLGVQRTEELIRWARNHATIPARVSGVAGLAGVVLDCASRGDTVADALLRHATGELLRAAKAVATKLGLDRSRQPFNLVLTGPMLKDGTLFMQYLLEVLKDGLPNADVIYPQGDGAEAAAWLALYLLDPQRPMPQLRRGLSGQSPGPAAKRRRPPSPFRRSTSAPAPRQLCGPPA
ncbi:hypothetical protein HYH03_008031 [Edaphochlamys debaryana]|uniref:N-acetyl-D-glucosamine kinase n=1 Tax=Edaphochlamys debaryana TaxID=47281 RepID=A0A836BZD0_9CHLO|nr:hypothetical protein HYH03_008031 [Edaphochlamys debaryana]|eukprot:KAG2493812.1 hypothetical protein HYH03_008031 [Edaphochlamys debaryana]